MIKKFLLLLLILAVPVTCMAAVAVQDDGTYVGEATTVNFTGTTVTYDGSVASVPCAEATIERVIQFTPGDFTAESLGGGGGRVQLATGTYPGLEEDNVLCSIVWADGEVTPAQTTFKVPADYSSGMGFRVFCDESGSSTANQIDFQVFVNGDAATWDAAATNQTPVALAGTGSTPDLVTLSTIATDFASLAAAQIVTLELWRDNTATGTNDLEVYYVEAYYTASQ